MFSRVIQLLLPPSSLSSVAATTRRRGHGTGPAAAARRRWMAPAAGMPSTGTKSRYADPPLPLPLLRSATLARAPRHHLPAPLPRPCVPARTPGRRLAARPVPRGSAGLGLPIRCGWGHGPDATAARRTAACVGGRGRAGARR